MKISVITLVPYPVDQVLAVMRDELPALAEYLPNVDKVEVATREELDGGEVKLLNKWKAAKTEVPTVARPFISQDKLNWLDYAHWHTDRVDWRLEMSFMTDRIKCEGSTRYTDKGGKTEVHIDGDLSIELKGLLPGILANKAKSTVEGFVIKMIEPNFQKTAEAVTRLLDDRAGK